MKKHKGFTLIELIVVILIIAMLLAILWPARSRTKALAKRLVCGTKLKGLGTAISVYAKDYNGYYPQLPGNGPWSKDLGFSFDNPNPDFIGVHANTPRTITACWYLLVRYSDVDPKSFVCREPMQIRFNGENSQNLDLVELWDFGSDPYRHVSYVMQNPYGKIALHENLPSGFAMAADMSPWFKDGNIIKPNENKQLPPQIIDFQNEITWNKGNSLNHTTSRIDKVLFFEVTRKNDCGSGQNILFADGHLEFEETPNVGINNDNIYTYWSKEENPTEQDIQGGTAPTERNRENDSKSKDDSFLVL